MKNKKKRTNYGFIETNIHNNFIYLAVLMLFMRVVLLLHNIVHH